MASRAVNGAMRPMIEPGVLEPDHRHIHGHDLALSNREGLIWRRSLWLKIMALKTALCILAEENSQCFFHFKLNSLANLGDQGIRVLTGIPALGDIPP
jgi:hypothetical protein